MKTIHTLAKWCSEKYGRTVKFDFNGKTWFGFLTNCDETCHASDEHSTLEALLENLFTWIKGQENENN